MGGGFLFDDIILRGDGTTLDTIAREDMTVPGGSGQFNQLSAGPVMNEQGQIAFFATVKNAGSRNGKAIYFHDEALGLIPVARIGDALEGGTITELTVQFGGFLSNVDQTYLGFNDRGQVAFGFGLADGRQGLARWSPPQSGGISVRVADSSATVVFQGKPLQSYTVQGTDGSALLGAPWSVLDPDLSADATGRIEYEYSPAPPFPPQQFFRFEEN